jgi:hypothetical protein
MLAFCTVLAAVQKGGIYQQQAKALPRIPDDACVRLSTNRTFISITDGGTPIRMTGREPCIQSLPITFWLLYIGGLSALSGCWLFYLEGVLEWSRVLLALWYTAALFVLIYFVIVSRVVWKSAAIYMRSPLLRKRIWGWTARSFVVFWALLTLFYGPGALTLVLRAVLAIVGGVLMLAAVWHPQLLTIRSP